MAHKPEPGGYHVATFSSHGLLISISRGPRLANKEHNKKQVPFQRRRQSSAADNYLMASEFR